MNAITLITILYIADLCCGTLLPPTGKNKKEKRKLHDKVRINENIFYSHLYE